MADYDAQESSRVFSDIMDDPMSLANALAGDLNMRFQDEGAGESRQSQSPDEVTQLQHEESDSSDDDNSPFLLAHPTLPKEGTPPGSSIGGPLKGAPVLSPPIIEVSAIGKGKRRQTLSGSSPIPLRLPIDSVTPGPSGTGKMDFREWVDGIQRSRLGAENAEFSQSRPDDQAALFETPAKDPHTPTVSMAKPLWGLQSHPDSSDIMMALAELATKISNIEDRQVRYEKETNGELEFLKRNIGGKWSDSGKAEKKVVISPPVPLRTTASPQVGQPASAIVTATQPTAKVLVQDVLRKYQRTCTSLFGPVLLAKAGVMVGELHAADNAEMYTSLPVTAEEGVKCLAIKPFSKALTALGPI